MESVMFNPLLQALEKSTAFYYIRTDISGRYTFVNSAFYEQFSHITQNFIGELSTNSVYADDIDKCNNAAYQCILHPDRVQRVNIRKPAEDGSFFWTDWEFSANFDEDGELSGINCVGYDVTSMVQKQEELRKYAGELEEAIRTAEESNGDLVKANSELDTFVYRVSHDLRAPISSMLGLIELSLVEPDCTNIHEYMRLQKHSLEKLDSFIMDILDYSRNARREIAPEEINLEAMIRDICTNFVPTGKNVSLEINIRHEAPLWADRVRLSMILNNLISNAYKFVNHRQEQSQIMINGAVDLASLQLSIADNGIGINQKYQQKVFNMFFRATDHKPGSGLGLYIAKEAVEKMGGIIDIESGLGEGTEITLRIPNLRPATIASKAD